MRSEQSVRYLSRRSPTTRAYTTSTSWKTVFSDVKTVNGF